jgi:hypothetical protein
VHGCKGVGEVKVYEEEEEEEDEGILLDDGDGGLFIEDPGTYTGFTVYVCPTRPSLFLTRQLCFILLFTRSLSLISFTYA